jgi:hypothetical protein
MRRKKIMTPSEYVRKMKKSPISISTIGKSMKWKDFRKMKSILR